MTCPLCELAKKTQQMNIATVYSYEPHESYLSPWPTIYFNCRVGYQIARESGRPVQFMPRHEPEIENFVRAHNIVEEHIDHVPLDEPVLSGYLVLPTKPYGELGLITILLDGHHRALRHFKEGRDCPTYMLEPTEMSAIMAGDPNFKWLEVKDDDLHLCHTDGPLIDR